MPPGRDRFLRRESSRRGVGAHPSPLHPGRDHPLPQCERRPHRPGARRVLGHRRRRDSQNTSVHHHRGADPRLPSRPHEDRLLAHQGTQDREDSERCAGAALGRSDEGRGCCHARRRRHRRPRRHPLLGWNHRRTKGHRALEPQLHRRESAGGGLGRNTQGRRHARHPAPLPRLRSGRLCERGVDGGRQVDSRAYLHSRGGGEAPAHRAPHRPRGGAHPLRRPVEGRRRSRPPTSLVCAPASRAPTPCPARSRSVSKHSSTRAAAR
jgi:hypothetical protein